MGLFEVLEVWRVCCLVGASTRLEAQGLGGLASKQVFADVMSLQKGGHTRKQRRQRIIYCTPRGEAGRETRHGKHVGGPLCHGSGSCMNSLYPNGTGGGMQTKRSALFFFFVGACPGCVHM